MLTLFRRPTTDIRPPGDNARRHGPAGTAHGSGPQACAPGRCLRCLRALAVASAALAAFDATAEVHRLLDAFRVTANPSGQWEFGERNAATGAFTRFTAPTDNGILQAWTGANPVAGTPSVFYNHTPNRSVSTTQVVEPYSAAFHPGPAPRSTSIRFNVPRKAKYTYRLVASGQDTAGTSTAVAALRNGVALPGALQIVGFGPATTRIMSGVVELDAADKLDFAVSGGASFANDSTGIDITVLEEQPDTWKPELRGFADIHNHMLANMAFGGRFIVGAPYGPLESVMSQDIDIRQHGHNHDKEIVGSIMDGRNGLFLHNDGPPLYGEWPTFRDTDHNKVHVDWLRRAVDGGLRLMVMLAIDSPLLCKTVETDGRFCDDEASVIDAQLDEAVKIQDALDRDAGGPGRGWFRIVTSPKEARSVVAQGKLAVVLGVETLNPLGKRPTYARLRELVNNKAVRQIFPVHQSDNALGGASYFECIIQREGNRSPWQWPACPTFEALDHILAQGLERFDMVVEDCPAYTKYGKCNTKGLTPLGQDIVTEMMRAGVIVDADHMSARSFADTIEIARGHGAPLVASHAGFTDAARPTSGSSPQDHEGQLSMSRYHALLMTGGMVGVMPASARSLGDVHPVERPSGKPGIPDRCGRSSETFAHSLMYATDHGDARGIALGTDFNTPSLLMPGPRFGRWACPGRANGTPSTARLGSTFLARGSGVSMSAMNIGQRTVDFNTQGLATVGQLPDLIADVEVLGMTPGELEPLFRAAETYIRMWEQADAAASKMLKRPQVFLPDQVAADQPVTFRVDAVDTYRGSPVPDSAQVFIDGVRVGTVRSDIRMTFKSKVVRGACTVDPRRRPPRQCEPDTVELPAPRVTVRNAPGFMDSEPATLPVH